MNELQIRLFGSPSIHINQEPVTGFVSSKATALVYYLAATNRTHGRDSLATLFWADVPTTRAKKNLRDILSNLRKVMGPFFEITRQTVALNAPPECTDLNQLILATPKSEGAFDEESRPDVLKMAADCYVGEFLEGFYIADAPLFEEWVLTEREHYRQLVLQLFNELVTDAINGNHHTDGIDYALRALALSPLEESIHRHLMSMYAATGQYAAALEQYEQCCQLLYDELGAEPSDETNQLFDNIQTRQNSPRPQRISDEHLQPFIGRESDLAEINRLLTSSDCRLLTLIGLGGVGKTRLARQAAIQNEHRFLDGTYFINVGEDSSAEQLMIDVADAIGISLSVEEEAKTQLLDYLRAKSMLLLFDNAERLHPSPAVDLGGAVEKHTSAPLDFLNHMVSSAPSVQVIATSRVRLGLRTEWLFDVAGLGLPSSLEALLNSSPLDSPLLDSSQLPSTESQSALHIDTMDSQEFAARALESDAVQLFIGRARQAWSGFAQEDCNLSSVDLVAISQLCQLVDGMPLALELAAGWVSMLSCQEIVDEVAGGIELLSSSHHDMPERHRSLLVVFDHAWEILTLDEQAILEKLSIFQAGFNRQAAQTITGATLTVLQNLMQRSFLSRSTDGRFRLHNLLRQYAYQRLNANASLYYDVQQQHARYFADSLINKQGSLLAEQNKARTTPLYAEADDLRMAFTWAIENRRFSLLQPLIDGLYRLFYLRNLLAEGILHFQSAAQVLHSNLNDSSPQSHRQANDEFDRAAAQSALGRITIRLGWLQQACGRHGDAQANFTHGHSWANDADNPSEQALCLLGQANMHFELANYADATKHGLLSLDLYQQLGDQAGAVSALNCLGKAQLATGEYHTARQNLSEALSLAQVCRLQSAEAECLTVLGQVCWTQGDFSASQAYFEAALAILRLPQIDNERGEAKVLNELGFMAWSQGFFEKAQMYHSQALLVFRQLGNRQGEGNTLSYLGRVAERKKEYANAAQLYKQAVVINREIRDKRGEAISIANLGFAAFRWGDFQEAEEYFAQCEAMCQAIKFKRYLALATAWLGLLGCFRHAHEESIERCQRSIEIASQIRDPIIEAYGWIHLGYAHAIAKEWAESKAAYSQGLQLRNESGDFERLLDPLSGLAYVALQQNDWPIAQRHVNELLVGLNEKTLASAFFAAQIHYVCYAVLDQNNEPEADHYKQMAAKLLRQNRPSSSGEAIATRYLREPLIQEHLAT